MTLELPSFIIANDRADVIAIICGLLSSIEIVIEIVNGTINSIPIALFRYVMHEGIKRRIKDS